MTLAAEDLEVGAELIMSVLLWKMWVLIAAPTHHPEDKSYWKTMDYPLRQLKIKNWRKQALFGIQTLKKK